MASRPSPPHLRGGLVFEAEQSLQGISPTCGSTPAGTGAVLNPSLLIFVILRGYSKMILGRWISMFLFHLHPILDTITCPLFQKQFSGETSVQKRLRNFSGAVSAMGCLHRIIVANVAMK